MMKLNGWNRLTILLSIAWVIAISVFTLYEYFHWEPTGQDLDGSQIFFYYYSDSTIQKGFIPLLKSLNLHRFFEVLVWPLIALWVSYFIISKGGRWVRKGFNEE